MTTKQVSFIVGLILLIAAGGYYSYPCLSKTTPTKSSAGNTPMIYPTFQCALEKDHTPPITPEAESYYQKARQLEKTKGWEDWPAIIDNYQKAIKLNHWKAMNNLALLYSKGAYGKGDRYPNPTAVKPDRAKQLDLYLTMMEQGVPLGYYNWSVAIQKGYVPNAEKGEATGFLFKAAQLGNPQAQVRLGNYFAFGLPKADQRDDIADQYFRCAGKQDDPNALLEAAQFYEIARKNKALAAYYYQKSASLGNYKSMMVMVEIFKQNDQRGFDLGYLKDYTLASLYQELFNELDKNADLKFPNLLKDHPLPRHPTQGYDADNPDVRPE